MVLMMGKYCLVCIFYFSFCEQNYNKCTKNEVCDSRSPLSKTVCVKHPPLLKIYQSKQILPLQGSEFIFVTINDFRKKIHLSCLTRF